MRRLLVLLLVVPTLLMAADIGNATDIAPINRLDSRYCIHYGSESAPHEITEYFSFSCPHCIRLFLDDFPSIEGEHLQNGKVKWTFHPVPVDLLTVQAMACLEQLSDPEKRIFLEEIFLEAVRSKPIDLPLLMEKIVEATGKTPPAVTDFKTLENTDAFQAAFLYVKGGIDIVGVPTLALDGNHLGEELPTKGFVRELTHTLCSQQASLQEVPCASF
ncbi:MAG: thioredoxin domain-containing protein [Candidatus Obscuribacterales bacterium]